MLVVVNDKNQTNQDDGGGVAYVVNSSRFAKFDLKLAVKLNLTTKTFGIDR